jgi:hypothetical protein
MARWLTRWAGGMPGSGRVVCTSTRLRLCHPSKQAAKPSNGEAKAGAAALLRIRRGRLRMGAPVIEDERTARKRFRDGNRAEGEAQPPCFWPACLGR